MRKVPRVALLCTPPGHDLGTSLFHGYVQRVCCGLASRWLSGDLDREIADGRVFGRLNRGSHLFLALGNLRTGRFDREALRQVVELQSHILVEVRPTLERERDRLRFSLLNLRGGERN